VRAYKTKTFARFARRERISDKSLCDALNSAEKGLIDADLGGGIIKQRVARPGRGKSGGYRTLVAYRVGELAVFMFGFAKSDRGNIGDDELEDLQAIAAQWLKEAANIAKDLEVGILTRVKCDDEDDDKKEQKTLAAPGGTE